MPRRSTLSHFSIEELQQEVRLLQRTFFLFEKKRARLLKQLAKLESDMGIKGSRGGAGSRPRNAMSLVEALQKVLKGKTLGVSEAAEAVKKSGYRSGAENFRVIVNATLLKYPKLFKRVGRGEYTAA